MRLIQRGPPVVGLSDDVSIPGEPSGFVAIDITVRIEPPQKRLPQPKAGLFVGLGGRGAASARGEQTRL